VEKEFDSNEAALENRGFSRAAFMNDFKEWQRFTTLDTFLSRE
jgi:hypothetical protein